jgi:hypothetical protein
MFDSSKNISTRLADAADLLIDFATLGEYGLEPIAKGTPSCETRHRRPLAAKAPRSRRRHPVEGPFLLRP